MDTSQFTLGTRPRRPGGHWRGAPTAPIFVASFLKTGVGFFFFPFLIGGASFGVMRDSKDLLLESSHILSVFLWGKGYKCVVIAKKNSVCLWREDSRLLLNG